MEKPSSEVIGEHFKLADRFLKSASLMLKDGDLRTAADRAYYAMFHAAEAALYHLGVTLKSHKALISQFSKEYIKTGKIDAELGGFLQKAFDIRQDSDYKVDIELDEQQVEELISRARDFVRHLRKLVSAS
jgi:uncharacterized protein (UPF0332 family)